MPYPNYYGATTTNLKQDGVDIGSIYVTREYLIDKYPDLADNLRSATMFSTGTTANSNLMTITSNTTSPTIQTSNNHSWKKISNGGTSGGLHKGAIKSDGTLWMWGRNAAGQLGDGSTINSGLVEATLNSGGYVDVACGIDFSIALNISGTLGTQVFCTGNNSNFQMSNSVSTTTSWTSVTSLGSLSPVQVACGDFHSFFLSANGQLQGVGLNSTGQLGDGSTVRRSQPVTTITGGQWRRVSCGGSHTMAIKSDGSLWGWGSNGSGQLGDDTQVNKSSPVQTATGGTNWKQIVCCGTNSHAIKTDGSLWGWGQNSFGSLGDGSATARKSPVETATGGTNWKSIAANGRVCAAVKTDGTLWTWGDNSGGTLGDNTTVSKSSPAQTITGGTDWKFAGVMLNASHFVKDTTQDLWL